MKQLDKHRTPNPIRGMLRRRGMKMSSEKLVLLLERSTVVTDCILTFVLRHRCGPSHLNLT